MSSTLFTKNAVLYCNNVDWCKFNFKRRVICRNFSLSDLESPRWNCVVDCFLDIGIVHSLRIFRRSSSLKVSCRLPYLPNQCLLGLSSPLFPSLRPGTITPAFPFSLGTSGVKCGWLGWCPPLRPSPPHPRRRRTYSAPEDLVTRKSICRLRAKALGRCSGEESCRWELFKDVQMCSSYHVPISNIVVIDVWRVYSCLVVYLSPYNSHILT